MVEGAPPLKQNENCDVKDERVLNRGGSKELELSNLPPYSKTNPNLNYNKKVKKSKSNEYIPLQDSRTSECCKCQENSKIPMSGQCWDIRRMWKSVYSRTARWSSKISKVFLKLGGESQLYPAEDKALLTHQMTKSSTYSSIQTSIDVEKVNSSDKADFERAIELTGYGKFHYLLLAICGFVSTSEEMDVISMSFILPAAQCDLELNTQTKGWLNSIIFIGMMCGAYAWGSMADAIGRKKVLIASSFMNALCIVASSFSQSYEWFMLFRFLNGAALGGSGPVIWPYFAEFQPKSKRGSMLSFMAAFWTLGNLFVAGLAWLIIPADINLSTPSFLYNSWRIFLLVMAVPSFIVGILLCFLPESPKYLLTRGKSEEAIAIFKHIYHINTGNPPEEYPVKHLIIEEDDQKALDEEAAQPKKGKYMGMLSDIMDNTKDLFVSPILKFTLISITINFTFHIGYYGLMMWFPEMFNRFDAYGKFSTEDANVCEVTNYVMKNASLLHNGDEYCANSKISQEVFIESLITVAAALPANIIAVLGMDRLGRKFFMIFSTLSSGTCAASMYWVRNKTQNLIVSATFSSVISCGNAALDCLITEIFPTNLRATGIAISMVSARLGGIIGNIVIATLLDLYCPAPTFIVAGLLIAGGVMCLFLPNTTKEPLA